jgi:hypothetical protein
MGNSQVPGHRIPAAYRSKTTLTLFSLLTTDKKVTHSLLTTDKMVTHKGSCASSPGSSVGAAKGNKKIHHITALAGGGNHSRASIGES